MNPFATYIIGIFTGAVLCFGAMNIAMQMQGLAIMKVVQ